MRLYVISSLILLLFSGTGFSGDNLNILIYYKANGWKHESREAGVRALERKCAELGIKYFSTEDSTYFTDDNLRNYDGVVFMLTSGDILDEKGEEAFRKFVENGGGFAGIHSATDTEYDWEWYGAAIGTYFIDHPEVQEARVLVIDKEHPSTKNLPDPWFWEDEWYNWTRELGPDKKVLLKVDEKSYVGGKHGDDHPVSWQCEIGKGRVWYTALGHKPEHYSNEVFLDHMMGGIFWTLGDN